MAIDYAKFREAAIAKGVPAKEVAAFIKKKQTEELVRQGVLDVGDIATSDPSTALRLTQEGIKPKGSAEEQKQAQKMTDLEQSVSLLEKNYREIEATGPVKGRATKLLSGLTGGAVAPEIADYEALRQSMIGPLARAISGEVGVLTDRDIGRAENLLPKVGDTPKVAEKKLNNLKTIIAEKTGKEPELQPEPKGGSILQSFLKSSRNIARDLGVGLAMKGKDVQAATQSAQQASEASRNLIQQALKTTDPQEKERLLKLSREVEGVRGPQGEFSEDIEKGYLSRGLEAGAEIATTAELAGGLLGKVPGVAGSPLTTARGPIKDVKILNLFNKQLSKAAPTINKANKLAEEGVKQATKKKIPGKSFINTLEEVARRQSPTDRAKPAFNKFLEAVKQEYKRGIPVENLKDEFIKYGGGYTAGGAKKSASQSVIDRVVRLAMREEGKKIGAEKIFEGVETAAKNKQVRKTLKSVGKIAGATTVGFTASTLLSNLFRRKE